MKVDEKINAYLDESKKRPTPEKKQKIMKKLGKIKDKGQEIQYAKKNMVKTLDDAWNYVADMEIYSDLARIICAKEGIDSTTNAGYDLYLDVLNGDCKNQAWAQKIRNKLSTIADMIEDTRDLVEKIK